MIEGNCPADPDRHGEKPFIDLQLHQRLNVHSLNVWHGVSYREQCDRLKCANQWRFVSDVWPQSGRWSALKLITLSEASLSQFLARLQGPHQISDCAFWPAPGLDDTRLS